MKLRKARLRHCELVLFYSVHLSHILNMSIHYCMHPWHARTHTLTSSSNPPPLFQSANFSVLFIAAPQMLVKGCHSQLLYSSSCIPHSTPPLGHYSLFPLISSSFLFTLGLFSSPIDPLSFRSTHSTSLHPLYLIYFSSAPPPHCFPYFNSSRLCHFFIPPASTSPSSLRIMAWGWLSH